MQDRNARRLSTAGYSARKTLLGVFVLVYALVAFWGGKVSPRGEFFPVFNWSLFTHVSDVRALAELYIVRIGDRTFDKPVNYFELDEYFASAAGRSTDIRKILDRLVYAVGRGDKQETAKLLHVLESQHLGGHGRVLYEIRLVEFRPVQRWRTGKVLYQQLLARVESKAAP